MQGEKFFITGNNLYSKRMNGYPHRLNMYSHGLDKRSQCKNDFSSILQHRIIHYCIYYDKNPNLS